MAYKRRRTNQEIVATVVARKTKGSAFMLDGDNYRQYMTKIRCEVSQEYESMTKDEFFKKYEIYLHDVRR